MKIYAFVRGTTHYPEHPDYVGHWGLCGGDDTQAGRSTFRSVGEAMTWARRVLDGDVRPRWKTASDELLTPNTGPRWSEAYVFAEDGNDRIEWYTEQGRREWHRMLSGDRLGEVARTDWPRSA